MGIDASRGLLIAGFVLTGFNSCEKDRSNRLREERPCWVTDQILATNQALSCCPTSAWLGGILVYC